LCKGDGCGQAKEFGEERDGGVTKSLRHGEDLKAMFIKAPIGLCSRFSNW
jgi:hypothetical protein